jgi:hypothetical protein
LLTIHICKTHRSWNKNVIVVALARVQSVSSVTVSGQVHAIGRVNSCIVLNVVVMVGWQVVINLAVEILVLLLGSLVITTLCIFI